MDGGAWWAAVHGVAKSRTWLSDFTFTFHFHALEKEMATHSSVLAWRIPGMREPGGLPSMGSHRVRHDWSDLAAAALCVYMYMYMHVCMYVYISVFICVCVRMCVYICVHVCVCMCIFLCACVFLTRCTQSFINQISDSFKFYAWAISDNS